MLRDNKEFRERFQRWKAGELVYDAGRAIPRYEGGKDTTGRIQSAIPLEVQHDPLGMQKAARIVQENAARVAALNSAQIGPSLNTPKQLLDYYRDKAETEAFMLRKREGELMADEMMKSLLDPRYIAAAGALGIIGKAAKSVITGSKLYKNFRLAREINRAVKLEVNTIDSKINMPSLIDDIKTLSTEFNNDKVSEFTFGQLLRKSAKEIDLDKLLSMFGDRRIIDKPVDNNLRQLYYNTTLPRLLYLRGVRWRQGLLRPTVKHNVDAALDKGYTVYPHSIFEKAGKGDFAGFHFGDTNHIAVDKSAEDFALGHEIRHRLDNYLSLTPIENEYLNKAYGTDFLNLSAGEYEKLKGIRMYPERVTTNFDARNELLGEFHATNTDWKLLNLMIDKSDDAKIFKAVEKSSGYGRAYIDWLRKNNKLTPELAKSFRDAMKFVGVASVPVGLSVPSLRQQ